jgi:hypothetical protein
MRALEQYVTHGKASLALAAEQLAPALRSFCGLTASPSTRGPVDDLTGRNALC